MRDRFSPAQVDQISRTVRRTPEVMVKVTGGGMRMGAVAAHFAYISRRGALEIETDEGERIARPDEQKRLLGDWHLELSAGQYRRQINGGPARRPTKLVHNIVLSMPAPTPPDKVLAAARQFAREKFAQHRYAMVLHTDQKHPHVHLVVKAENELGRRLHIDKQDPWRLARGLCAIDARTGYCGERDAAGHSRRKQEKTPGNAFQSAAIREIHRDA
jgi:relaxase-like protein